MLRVFTADQFLRGSRRIANATQRTIISTQVKFAYDDVYTNEDTEQVFISQSEKVRFTNARYDDLYLERSFRSVYSGLDKGKQIFVRFKIYKILTLLKT